MDKPLQDKNKATQSENGQDEMRPAAQAAPAAAQDFSKQNVGAYNPELTAQAWDKANEPKALKDSVKGRGMIRMFSRGVMGASAFALGGLYAGKSMKTYAPNKAAENWVQYIAKAFDYGAGVPIKTAVNLIGRDGEKFVNNFRPSVLYPGYGGKQGRSLGHEVVMVTFDFASMSIGDFWGRKIVHTLDPNKAKPVWKNDDGSIDWGKALKTFGKNWWTAITYSAGEDWAVAVPYCLTMRHLGTPAINKMFPGYKFDFDLNGNGGGIIIDNHGKMRGNFTAAGVFNIWERFTTYNVGTLMFREAYHWIGQRVEHLVNKREIPKLVEEDPANPTRSKLGTVVDGAEQFANWLTRSTVKAVMYMIPAVPFFWITRVPQHKFKGAFIHPEKGVLQYNKNGKDRTAVHMTTMHSADHPDTRFTDRHFTANTPVYFTDGSAGVNPFSHGKLDAHAQTYDVVDTLLNPIAKATVKVREKLRGPIGKAFSIISAEEGKMRAGTYINASMAYTPYFFMKSDFLADRWDYGRMDAALDRAISGVVRLKPSEFMAGVGETWQAIKRKPLTDPVREEYANCREATDSTPSDNKFEINPVVGGNCDDILMDANHPSFTSRVGHKNISPEAIKAQQEIKAAPEKAQPKIGFKERMIHGGKKTEVVSPRGVSHAEAEEMRKALEEFNPPTNSIN